MINQNVLRLPDEQLRPLADAYARAMRAKRIKVLAGLGGLVALVILTAIASEVDLAKFSANIWRFPNYITQLAPPLTWANLGGDIAEWFWGWSSWGKLLVETLLIAYLGTAIGGVGAFVLCFFAAANVAPSRFGRLIARRYLELCRTVPEIVFALIFVIAFGLGALPGVLAIAIHTTGALGKLFSEVVENIDMKPVDGVTSTGANWVEAMRFAAVPQVLSGFVSYLLLRFEINVRGAAIMGFVGAGGIGQELVTAIRKFYYADISAMLLMIIATVMLIDYGTERLRHRLIGMEGRS